MKFIVIPLEAIRILLEKLGWRRPPIVNGWRPPVSSKPASGLWRHDPATREGKYLVTRRDGTIPDWPNFVIGAKDPAAPAALLAYAAEARRQGFNAQYCRDVEGLANEFDRYRRAHGAGDPDRARHRPDDPATIERMRHGRSA